MSDEPDIQIDMRVVAIPLWFIGSALWAIVVVLLCKL
jgi:hypothetical protein